MANHSFPSHRLPLDLRTEAGFSLLEIIAVLVLLGILAGGMAVGFTGLIKGYTNSRDAAAIATKGQLALLRLSREFRVISSVTSASATAITFVAKHGDVTNVTYTLSKSGSSVTLNDGAGNNDLLVDNVNTLSLAYYDTMDGTAQSTWTASRRIIELTLTLNGPNGTTMPFTIRVAPRNL